MCNDIFLTSTIWSPGIQQGDHEPELYSYGQEGQQFSGVN